MNAAQTWLCLVLWVGFTVWFLSRNIWPGGRINILLDLRVCIASLTQQWNWTFIYHLPYCACVSFTPLSFHLVYKCLPFSTCLFIFLPLHFSSTLQLVSPPFCLCISSFFPSFFFCSPALSNSFLPFAVLEDEWRWHDVIFKFQEICAFISSGFIVFFGCRRTLNVHQRQDTRLIHNEVGWFAFLQGKKKNAPVLCVFCGSLMNYWSFFYLVSAQLFFRIQKCCFLSEHSWIVSFFVFLFLFLYIPYTLSRPPPNSPLAQCSVSLRPLHPPVLPPLPLYSLFSLSRCHIIPFTMVLPSPCLFFLSLAVVSF